MTSRFATIAIRGRTRPGRNLAQLKNQFGDAGKLTLPKQKRGT